MVFKKKRTILPITALLAMMALSACGGSATSNAGSEKTATNQQTPTMIATVDPCVTPTTAYATQTAEATAITSPTAHAIASATAEAKASATADAEASATASAKASPTSTGAATPSVGPETATALACASATATHSGTPSGTSSTSAQGATIKSENVTLNGKATKVLADGRGMTLYYYKNDTALKSMCTGTCATTWHPVLANSSKVNDTAKLPGAFSVVKTSHGNQVAYNGHLLYTYSKDSAAGQANGANAANSEWSVATADLPMQH